MSIKNPTICPYCGGKVIFTDSAVLYHGKSYGDIYLCTNCNASVGVHKGTKKPLGTLANSVLKLKRRETHAVFDGWWQSLRMNRTAAYQWLSGQMGLPVYRTHIGQFDMEQCERVIQIVCKATKIRRHHKWEIAECLEQVLPLWANWHWKWLCSGNSSTNAAGTASTDL